MILIFITSILSAKVECSCSWLNSIRQRSYRSGATKIKLAFRNKVETFSFLARSMNRTTFHDSCNIFFFFFIYAYGTLYRVISSMSIAARTNSTETISQTFVQGLQWYTTKIHVCYLHTCNWELTTATKRTVQSLRNTAKHLTQIRHRCQPWLLRNLRIINRGVIYGLLKKKKVHCVGREITHST